MKHKFVLLACFTGVAMALAYAEALLIPPLPIPGGKLGLPNVITILALDFFGLPSALLINTVRSVSSALLYSGAASLLYSLSGGLGSAIVMYLGKKLFAGASHIGVGMLGGFSNNCIQTAVAACLTNTLGVWGLFPLLGILGTVSGFCTGLVAELVKKYIPNWK